MNIDVEYLCNTIGSLAGMPVRIYKDGEKTFYYSLTYLPKDPIEKSLEEILEIKEHVGYYSDEDFCYYGVVNSNDIKIVIGPSRQIPYGEHELRKLSFELGVPQDETESFVIGMRSILCMPLESILQILCTMNHVLNGEKISLKDITIQDRKEAENIPKPEHFSNDYDRGYEGQSVHNTYDIEREIINIVRKGDLDELKKWTDNAPAVRPGILAGDQLRQIKNTFIVTTALISRAAIRGGVDVDDAFTLSDLYIQKCEMLRNPEKIINLQYKMTVDFTGRVNAIRKGANPGKLVIDVTNYIHHHISRPITVNDISEHLYISRPYLSKRFKEESGENLTDFILKEKISEAKNLLRYSDKSLMAIGEYLGFSSQGHFTKVFKKYAKCTPKEYREKHSK